jgi:hypothetical protein
MATQIRSAIPNEDKLLDAARKGDENAFARLVEPYRRRRTSALGAG